MVLLIGCLDAWLFVPASVQITKRTLAADSSNEMQARVKCFALVPRNLLKARELAFLG